VVVTRGRAVLLPLDALSICRWDVECGFAGVEHAVLMTDAAVRAVPGRLHKLHRFAVCSAV